MAELPYWLLQLSRHIQATKKDELSSLLFLPHGESDQSQRNYSSQAFQSRTFLSINQIERTFEGNLRFHRVGQSFFINQFNLSSNRHCFKVLRSLGCSTNLPTTMFHDGATFNNDFDIASEFNIYFASVFNDKDISPLPDNTSSSNVGLIDLNLSLENIRVLLKKFQ